MTTVVALRQQLEAAGGFAAPPSSSELLASLERLKTELDRAGRALIEVLPVPA